MNTHARHAVTARLSYGAAVKWCVALACAAYAYGLLEPAATARARLDACVNKIWSSAVAQPAQLQQRPQRLLPKKSASRRSARPSMLVRTQP